MPWMDGYTSEGLYGMFGHDEELTWAMAVFEKHVLIFGTPHPEAFLSCADDMKTKIVKKYPDCSKEVCYAAYAEIFPEYSGVDHDAVMRENTAKLKEEAAKIIQKRLERN